MFDICFFFFNCKINCVDSKKKVFRVYFLFKLRINIFKEMISWIVNIKELVDFEIFDVFKRIGRLRLFFFYCNDFIKKKSFV